MSSNFTDRHTCMTRDVEARDAFQLQEEVRQQLDASQQNYIKKRTIDDYSALSAQQRLRGVFLDSQLAAFLIFTIHRVERYKTDFNPTKQFLGALDGVYDFGIIGGLMVRPKLRGLGLARDLIASTIAENESIEQDKIFAETIEGNMPSISCFIHNGFHVVGHEHFEPLGANLCLLEFSPAQHKVAANQAA